MNTVIQHARPELILKKELEQTNIDLSYNCYEKSDKSRFWDPIEPNVKKN